MLRVGNNLRPGYAKLPNGSLVRMLTTDDGNGSNQPVAGEGMGSGFVIDNQGRVLTNKHVAAAWMIGYGFRPYEMVGGGLAGVVIPLGASLQRMTNATDLARESQESLVALREWVPGADLALIFNSAGVPVRTAVRGDNDALDAGLPNSTVRYAARIINLSSEGDVAVIRVDGLPELVPVELAQDDNVRVGQRITVMGYPAVAQRTVATRTVIEMGQQRTIREYVPNITAVDGTITNVARGIQQQGDAVTRGMLGASYQLSVSATGAGNSWGPVFDEAGRVIGIFTFSNTVQGTRVSHAIPISIARNLINPQNIN